MDTDGWLQAPLSALARVNPRYSVEKGAPVPFVDMASLRTDSSSVNHVGEREAKGSGSRFKRGDTLFARITPCAQNGKTAFVDFLDEGTVGMGSTEFIVLAPVIEKLEPRYLYHLAKSDMVRTHAIAQMEGTSGRQRVPNRVFDEIEVGVPPLGEQRKIAEILGSVDEAIQATQAVIEQTRKVKQGLLQRLLTRGIGHTRFKQTEIGEIPESWDVTTVASLCSHIVDCLHLTPEYTDDGPYVIRSSDVVAGRLIFSSTRHVSDETYAHRIGRLTPEPGDVLYVREGARFGIAAPVPDGVELCLGQRMLHLRADSHVHPGYLLCLMNSPIVVERAKADVGGSASPHVNIGSIRKFMVPCPPREEQQEIGRLLSLLEQTVCDSEAAAVSLSRLKQVLMQDLLTGRVRVTP